jgi:cytochrome c oxidase subunit IV
VSAKEGQQHPIAIYLWIWLLLFVFSTFSYAVDYFHLQGALRWSLILLFMFLKAGFIVAIFMHMQWERIALKLAILVPPLALLILIGLMAVEGDYTFITRSGAFTNPEAKATHVEHSTESSPYNATHDAQTRSVTGAEQGP